jgi:hypothetical protein
VGDSYAKQVKELETAILAVDNIDRAFFDSQTGNVSLRTRASLVNDLRDVVVQYLPGIRVAIKRRLKTRLAQARREAERDARKFLEKLETQR